MDATCHYCERPASFAVTLRTRATEQVMDQRQRLCQVHDAIVAGLRSVSVLERRPWHVLPDAPSTGTLIGAGPDFSTIAQAGGTYGESAAASRPAGGVPVARSGAAVTSRGASAAASANGATSRRSPLDRLRSLVNR